jgi:hypothetical protein
MISVLSVSVAFQATGCRDMDTQTEQFSATEYRVGIGKGAEAYNRQGCGNS